MKACDVIEEFKNVLKSNGIDENAELTDEQQEQLQNHFDTALDAVSEGEDESDE